MTWASPWALALAAALVLPLIAHLWSQRNPTAIDFPTLRFLRAASPVSRRLRRLQDWPLWLLRCAIVLVIAGAAAGPTWNSLARRESWRARVFRTVVLTPSVAERIDEATRGLAPAEATRVLRGDEPAALLPAAVRLATRDADEGRAEIVLAWDGSRTSLSAADLKAIPDAIGVRLVALDAPAREGPPQVSATSPPALPLEILAPASDAATRDALVDLLRARQVPIPEGRVRILWPGARVPEPQPEVATATPSARRALAALRDDVRVRDAAQRSPASSRAKENDARVKADVLARRLDGTPALFGWAEARGLTLVLDAAPTSPLAWWSAVAALESLSEPARWPVPGEDGKWTPVELAAASRDAAPATDSALPGGLDTRWAWLTALILLSIEQFWRRQTRNDTVTEDAARSRADAA